MDGGKGGGEQILLVFEKRLTDNIRKLNFEKILEPANVRRIVEEADGYQPHLIAPEMGYRRLLQVLAASPCLSCNAVRFSLRRSRCHLFQQIVSMRPAHAPCCAGSLADHVLWVGHSSLVACSLHASSATALFDRAPPDDN